MPESPLFADQLRDKALLALEDAVQETRYRTPRPSFAVRFALAYLWAYGGGGDRGPYDDFWRAMGAKKGPASHTIADVALLRIYLALGVERQDAIGSLMWRRWSAHEGGGGRHAEREGR